MKLFSPVASSIILSLAVFAFGCRAEVHAQLTEAQANEVVGVLAEKGLDVDKEPGNLGHYTVTVSRGELGRALQILRAESLPRAEAVGLEVIGQGDALVPSFLTEQAQLARALSGELEKSIGALAEVERVNVQLAFANEEPALLAPTRARIERASVVLRTGAPIDHAPIVALVIAAVPTLKSSDILVIEQPATMARRPDTFERVGPFFVAAQSRLPLQRALLCGLVTLLVLALLLIVQSARVMRASVDR